MVGLLTGLEGTWKTPAHRAAWVGEGGKVGAFDTALGTIGAGNHFAELQEVELGVPGVVETGEAVLLVHSGSRGFGGYVLGRFYDRESKVESVREGRIDVEQQPGSALEYLALHDRACVWARANRDLIALRFLQVLEPGGGWECVDVKGVAGLRVRVQQRKFVDIHHNNVVKALWPPAADIQEEVYIHRKGAAPTTPDHPLLPLPGSRGTPTLLLRPLYTEENGFGERHAMSAAHGAGRAMSRAEAKNHLWRRYDEGNGREVVNGFTGSMGGKGGRDEGEGDFVASASAVKKKAGSKGTLGWVVCDQKELIWEEAPAAYKDVEAVGRDLVKAGVVAVVGRCRPLVTYKGKKE